MEQSKTFIVNTGFQDDNGRIYNSGQHLTQAEYNLLPMNMKVRCSVDTQIKLPGERDDLTRA